MRMYRNCPERGRKECSGCPRFKRCLVKKLKRKLKKNHLGIKILWVVFIIVMIFFLANKVAEEQREEWIKSRSDIATNELTTEKFEVTTVSVAINPTSIPQTQETDTSEAKATETPKVKTTKKPNTIKVKKAAKVTKEKQKGNTISAEILEAYAELSAYDLKLMEKVVCAEAKGEPYKGKVAVASVILNRYIFSKMKISIEEIVTAKYQFADISNVTENMLSEYPDCKKAVEEAIKGNDPTRVKFPEGARYFYRPEWVSEHQREIRKGVPVLIIGHHHFHNDFKE